MYLVRRNRFIWPSTVRYCFWQISKISDDFQHFFQERTLIWLLVLLPLAACGVNLPFVRLEDLITKPLLGRGMILLLLLFNKGFVSSFHLIGGRITNLSLLGQKIIIIKHWQLDRITQRVQILMCTICIISPTWQHIKHCWYNLHPK